MNQTFDYILHKALVLLEEKAESADDDQNTLLFLKINVGQHYFNRFFIVDAQRLKHESEGVKNLEPYKWRAAAIRKLRKSKHARNQIALDLFISEQNSENYFNNLLILNQLITDTANYIIPGGLIRNLLLLNVNYLFNSAVSSDLIDLITDIPSKMNHLIEVIAIIIKDVSHSLLEMLKVITRDLCSGSSLSIR